MSKSAAKKKMVESSYFIWPDPNYVPTGIFLGLFWSCRLQYIGKYGVMVVVVTEDKNENFYCFSGGYRRHIMA